MIIAGRTLLDRSSYRPYPQYGWDFPEEIPEKVWKDPRNTLRARTVSDATLADATLVLAIFCSMLFSMVGAPAEKMRSH